MIDFDVRYKKSNIQRVRFYHWWDLPDNAKVVENIREVTLEDKGSFYKFNDGSGLYAKITHCSTFSVRLSTGLCRRDDLVTCSIPKHPHGNYSGAVYTEEHPLVRKFKPKEYTYANQIIDGTYKEKFASQRVKLLVKKKLQKSLESKHKVDEDYVADKLVQMAEGGQHQFKAIKAIAYLLGISIEEPKYISRNNKPQLPLYDRVNQTNIFVGNQKQGNDIIDGKCHEVGPDQVPYRPTDPIPNLRELKKMSALTKKITKPIL